ncbi:30S ribosomal protein S4 [Nanoarchaeota archaeon]
MKRKHKRYSKPKRPFDKIRIDEEAKIKKEFGLKNKKEIWKADSRIKSIREKAKKLISAEPEEQKALFVRLKKTGLEVNSIADVLALTKEDYMNRRLQTIVAKKRIATTLKGARQLINHKKVLVDGKVVNTPSYIVSIELENKIKRKPNKKKTIKEKVIETVTEEAKKEASSEAKLEEPIQEESKPEEVKE